MFAAVYARAVAAFNTNTAQLVERWLWYPKEMSTDGIPADQRAQIIAELRKQASSTAKLGFQDMAKTLLLRLGDAQTIAEVMQDIRSDDVRRSDEATVVLRSVYNPELIPLLADLLYLPERMAVIREPGSDIARATRPFWASEQITLIILKRAEFGSDVKDWLKSHSSADVCQLWEQNKEAFLRKDYAAVKPPKSVPKSFLPTATNPSSGRVGAPSAK